MSRSREMNVEQSRSTKVEKQFRKLTRESLKSYKQNSRIIPTGIPAGVGFMHPYPIYIRGADGCYVYDADGRRHVDLLSGLSSLPLGHNHPKVRAAVVQQIQHGTNFGGPVVDLAYKHASMLQRRMPSLERLRYTNSGSEATMFALRLSRAFTGRPKIAKIDGGYNGTHDGVFIANARSSAGVVPGVAENVVLLPYNNAKACEAIIKRERKELAAVIVEPMMGTNGMIPGRPEFLKCLREVTRRHKILLIFDEVITFGLSPSGAQGLYGITPDLTTMGKVIGAGLPLAAFGGRADVMALLDQSQPGGAVVYQGITTGGHPLSLAAGIAHLELLTPRVYRQLHSLGDRLRKGVEALALKHDIPLQVTGIGHFFGFHWTRQKVVDFASALSSDAEARHIITLNLRNKGFLLFPQHLGCLNVAMTPTVIDQFVSALDETLVETGLAVRLPKAVGSDEELAACDELKAELSPGLE